MDLNVENLFLTDQGLTVIDCETVFFNLQNLSATGLIPNRNMLYQCSGASKIFQGVTSISPDEIASFANRFIFSLDLLKSLEGPLIKKIYNSNSFLTTPIRVIFRDTYLYANLLARPSENYRLFEEEFKQLGKGDIPYFFFYLNDKNIYYYSNESYQTHPVSKEMMEFFHQKFSMELPSADFINNFQSDIETKKIKSLLEIVDFLLLFSTQKEEEFEVSLNGYQVQVEPSIITCTSKGSSHSIAMVRKYIDENDLDLEDTRLKEINKDFNFSLSKEPTIFITLS